ncbi:hypothetical protein BAS10_06660 [Elizabethkingia meningoseptica]|uniref:hypothetical protein n=1 Tax=Elizabethkingia meningoseptica TaxID=238 RepID=UPI00099A3B42|nr:hypothetical protein [Elizabethkingia meningoseptica]OPB96730.1 hypothetical protein BAS10_06660 [Elizabethkingia meningoseptica]
MEIRKGDAVAYEGVPKRRLVVAHCQDDDYVVCIWNENGIVWYGSFHKLTLIPYKEPTREIIFF